MYVFLNKYLKLDIRNISIQVGREVFVEGKIDHHCVEESWFTHCPCSGISHLKIQQGLDPVESSSDSTGCDFLDQAVINNHTLLTRWVSHWQHLTNVL